MAQKVNHEHLIVYLKVDFEQDIKVFDVIRHLFMKFETIEQADIADHYSVAFNIHQLDVLSIYSEWMDNVTAGLTDNQFDALILNVFPLPESPRSRVIECAFSQTVN